MAQFIDLPDPIVNKNNTILNCMITWLKWNELIEEKASWRYRIEDLTIPVVNKKLCEELEIPRAEIKDFKHTNARQHIELRWQDVLEINPKIAYDIRVKAEEYGYER